MTWVVDASTAVKWFVREELHENALLLLDRGEPLCAPDLLITETANIVWKKAVLREISEDQATVIAGNLSEYVPLLYPATALIERALRIALSLNHPVYDCLYLACAEEARGVMVTADRRFCARLQGTGFENRVRHLADTGLFDGGPT
jgi:predicted nucleic acid-binding protein